MKILQKDIRKDINYAYARGSAVFANTAAEYTGNFYGITIVTMPASIKFNTTEDYELNSSALAYTDDLSSYLPTGQFLPLHFDKVTIGADGYVILWKE